jgi:hypothetical protein
MGYVMNGKYYKGTMPKNVPVPHSLHRQSEHNTQRANFQKEIIQPYIAGKPNEEFIAAYPEQAKEYGMIKDED